MRGYLKGILHFFTGSLVSGGLLMAQTRQSKTSFLVHGAFADGSSWSKVIPLLSSEGPPCHVRRNPAHFVCR